MSAFWADWRFWLYLMVWAPFTALAVWYGVSQPHPKDAVGRSLLAVTASLSIVLTIVLTAFIWPGAPWRPALITIGLLLVAAAGWRQLFVFARIRRSTESEESP